MVCIIFHFHLEPASQLFIRLDQGWLLHLYGGHFTPGPWADARPGHLVASTTPPNPSHRQLGCWQRWYLFRRQISSGGVPSLHSSLCPPLQHLPPSALPWAAIPPRSVLHPSLELTRIVHLPGVHWPSTPQGQPPLRTRACQALHNLGTSSSAHRPGTAQT